MLLALTQLHWVIESATFRELNQSTPIAIELPARKSFRGMAEISLRFSLPYFSGQKLQITPDERLVRLQVNGREVDLSHVAAARLADWHNGVVLDLRGYLHPGANELLATVENREGSGGAMIEYLPLGWICAVPYLVFVCGALCVFAAIASGFRLQRSLWLIAGFSLAMVVLYWLQTPFFVRQFDIYEGGGHLDYLRYLLAQHRLPPINAGWEYHQPPGYYLTATWFYALGEKLPALGWPGMLRILSMLYWMVFLGAGLAIIQMYLGRSRKLMVLAALAFCCWPAGFIHALRVGNDGAFYAWYTLGLWAACKWWTTRNQRWFGWALLFCLLAMLSKASGLALAATLLVLLSVRWWQESRRVLHTRYESLLQSSIGLAITVLLAGTLSFGRKLNDYLHGRSSDWLLADAASSIGSGLRVANDWRHLLGFDWRVFLAQPWLNAWDDTTGRQYFWNYVLRSAISSEFAFHDVLKPVAIASGVLLLLLLGYLLLQALICMWRIIATSDAMALRTTWRIMPLLVSGLSLLLLLWAFRYKVPYSCSADFRYIYPAVLSVIVISGVLQSRSSVWRRWALPLAPLLGVTGICVVILM